MRSETETSGPSDDALVYFVRGGASLEDNPWHKLRFTDHNIELVELKSGNRLYTPTTPAVLFDPSSPEGSKWTYTLSHSDGSVDVTATMGRARVKEIGSDKVGCRDVEMEMVLHEANPEAPSAVTNMTWCMSSENGLIVGYEVLLTIRSATAEGTTTSTGNLASLQPDAA